MIDEQLALEIKKRAADAKSALSSVLFACNNRCSPEEFKRLKRGVGLAIGQIEIDILGLIYEQYPILDEYQSR